jgi:signal transduction histidine kinase
MKPWPGSLAGRVALLLVAGLLAAYGLSLWSAMRENAAQGDAMMRDYLARDVEAALRLLDRLPPAERADWLPQLARPHYRWRLEAPEPGVPDPALDALRAQLVAQLGAARFAGAATEVVRPGTAAALQSGPAHGAPPRTRPGASAELQLGLRLSDGQPLTLLLTPPVRRPAPEALLRWALQALLLGACVLLAVRLVTRPLATLAGAATRLGDDPQAPPLPEEGPSELRRAAAAFNTMQKRFAAQTAERIAERVQILAAVSHDLQSPITRLRLRSELLPDDGPGGLRARVQADLDEMQQLVDSGLAYARSAHAALEPPRPVDLAALLDAIACDRIDAGQPVAWTPAEPCVLPTRPDALKRIVGNLLDNALKFAGQAELAVEEDEGRVLIAVRDRGPGIPPGQLAQVQQPFVRGEPSRNRATGGSGLGLAIVQRLAEALDARFELRPRDGGGLQALLWLPAAPARQNPATAKPS